VSGWRGEATALLADAGEWLREWIEEGVEDFDRSLAGPVPAPEVPIGPEALLSPPVEAPGRAAPPPRKAVSPPSEPRAPLSTLGSAGRSGPPSVEAAAVASASPGAPSARCGFRTPLRTWLGLKVSTRRALIGMGSPVCGFRPTRSRL